MATSPTTATTRKFRDRIFPIQNRQRRCRIDIIRHPGAKFEGFGWQTIRIVKSEVDAADQP
jgi:hypothetical protein